MPALDIKIVRFGDEVPWPEVDREQILHYTDTMKVAVLEGGMSSGKPSVALRIDLDDGRTLIAETSLDLLIGVLATAHGAFPQSFVGGLFDIDALRAEIDRLRGTSG
jgi:hypothetical protein